MQSEASSMASSSGSSSSSSMEEERPNKRCRFTVDAALKDTQDARVDMLNATMRLDNVASHLAATKVEIGRIDKDYEHLGELKAQVVSKAAELVLIQNELAAKTVEVANALKMPTPEQVTEITQLQTRVTQLEKQVQTDRTLFDKQQAEAFEKLKTRVASETAKALALTDSRNQILVLYNELRELMGPIQAVLKNSYDKFKEFKVDVQDGFKKNLAILKIVPPPTENTVEEEEEEEEEDMNMQALSIDEAANMGSQEEEKAEEYDAQTVFSGVSEPPLVSRVNIAQETTEINGVAAALAKFKRSSAAVRMQMMDAFLAYKLKNPFTCKQHASAFRESYLVQKMVGNKKVFVYRFKQLIEDFGATALGVSRDENEEKDLEKRFDLLYEAYRSRVKKASADVNSFLYLASEEDAFINIPLQG